MLDLYPAEVRTAVLALFDEGGPLHTAVLPVGGNNVTNDIVYGLKTSFAVAEQLKVLHATVDLRDVDPDEEIGVSVMGAVLASTATGLFTDRATDLQAAIGALGPAGAPVAQALQSGTIPQVSAR